MNLKIIDNTFQIIANNEELLSYIILARDRMVYIDLAPTVCCRDVHVKIACISLC